MDRNFNKKLKTFSSTGSHSLLIHFYADDVFVLHGFSASIHHIPITTTCADFLNKPEIMLNNANDCTTWIITAPSITSTIDIMFQYFEVYEFDPKGWHSPLQYFLDFHFISATVFQRKCSYLKIFIFELVQQKYVFFGVIRK